MSTLEVDKEVYLCKSCGAKLHFHIGEQSLACEYCGEVMEIINEHEIIEHDFNELINNVPSNQWDDEAMNLTCDSCGANIIVEHNDLTKVCPYCNSSNIILNNHNVGIKPEAILPFMIDQQNAKDIARKWMSRRYFAPKDLKTLYQGGKLRSIYLPYWTYDAQTYSTYTGRGGEHYYVTVQRDGKSVRERRTRWYSVSGVVTLAFDDVLVSGSTDYDNNLVDRVDQFNTINLKAYDKKYIAGFAAFKYNIEPVSGFESAKGIMENEIYNEARNQILRQYDEASSIQTKTTYQDIKYKHVLMPIWAASYSYKGKQYNYFINGETGIIHGKSPISWVKVTILTLFIITMLATILYFYQ